MTATVLVVEDDELIASSLVRALRSKGYDASSTSTVKAAIGAIEEASPDLVLLDLGLPTAMVTRSAASSPATTRTCR